MADSNASQIMTVYDAMKGVHDDFRLSVERLIRDFLVSDGIRFVDVTSRLKERGSLEGKITRKGEGRYKTIADITDICGARVITYLEGDVRRVADIVEREFEIDRDNSVDKSRPADPDRFGYRSVHYVVGHRADRIRLREYSRFNGLKIEIQIRSILQHAWAEIEHDLGYKSEEDVPVLVKRRFSRLAGLLELADEEFMTIRDAVEEYEQSLPARLADASAVVPIDAESYSAFVNTDQIVARIDERIAKPLGAILTEMESKYVGSRVAMMNALGFDTIGDLRNALIQNEDVVVEVADRWLSRDGGELKGYDWSSLEMSRGISTFYLGYVLLLQSGDKKFMMHYVNKYLMRGDNLVREILDIFHDFPRARKE